MTTIRHRIARVLLAALFAASIPHLHAQNASTIRATSKALIGRQPLSEQDQRTFDRLQAEALKDPAVNQVLIDYESAHKDYQANQRKFPAERDPAVAAAFRKATLAATAALRKAMIAADPEAGAALFALIDHRSERRKNEGENDTDSDTGNKTAVAPVKDVPGLPRVLLIGDSVSIGYTLQVRALLDGVANVHRIPVNGGATDVGLAKIDDWLGTGKWDVIHFNFGLHDAKYLAPTELRSTREVYIRHLQALIDRMKATGAKLVFATTTPVPEMLQHGKATGNRVFDSIPERNALAVELMKKNGVAVDDLYTLIANGPPGLARNHDVHYNPEGYVALSKAVADSIRAQLPKPTKP
ncbi:MAG: SGNH/GDSL hydrolase family protein [Opitutaceae bacterium]|jgi:acyl-CoA thioesterase-1